MQSQTNEHYIGHQEANEVDNLIEELRNMDRTSNTPHFSHTSHSGPSNSSQFQMTKDTPRVFRRQLEDQGNELEVPVCGPLVKVMSYNVWYHSKYWQERMENIVRIIKRGGADVVSLIDVSKEAFRYITDALESFYLVFQVFVSEGKSSGIVMLFRRETIEVQEENPPYYYDLPHGATIIGTEVVHKTSGNKFHVLTTKLDDNPENDHHRQSQCETIHQIIRKDKINTFILIGDMNFFNKGEIGEQKMIQMKIRDAWLTLSCPYKVKYTFDGKNNPIIVRTKDRFRTARTYYRGRFHARSLSIVGQAVISKDLPIPPSPYYGLESTLELQ
jgi:hypothetical protein